MGGPITVEVHMYDKRPPKWTSKVAPDPSPVEGVDNLPIPSGTNREALRDAERSSEMIPGAMGNRGNEANGDNPSIPDVAGFATGKDVRSYGDSPSAPPTPAMPGA